MNDEGRVPRPTRRGYKAMAALLAGVAVFLVVRGLEAPDGLVDETPADIKGRWTTDDARYGDRAFLIEDDMLHIEVGSDSVLSYRTVHLQRFPEADFDRYVLTYHTREGEATQEFRRLPDGTLRLKNPPDVVWSRR